MIVKRSEKKSWIQVIIEQYWHSKKYRFMSVLLYSSLIFFLGVYIHRTEFFHNRITPIKVINANINFLRSIVVGALARPEHITIDIKHNDFQKLVYKQQIALATGVLISTSNDYVSANIRYKDKTIKVKIRLKGDWTEHLEGDKWSFRIQVKGKEFST